MRQALISKSALLHNIKTIKAKAGKVKVMAYIKANAYGHGLKEVASIISGQVDGVTVSDVDDACYLADNKFIGRVVLTSTIITKEICALASKYNFELVVYNKQNIESLQYLTVPINVWLKINTGMNRLGVNLGDVPSCLSKMKSLNNIKSITLMTHGANLDNKSHELNQKQIDKFKVIVSTYKLESCFANSAWINNFPDLYFDWVRLGINLYGISYSHTKTYNGLMPVMTLRGQVIDFKRVFSGDKIGYGSLYSVKKDSNIAIIAMGYADGLPWSSLSQISVVINNKEYPLVGRISMDLCIANLGQDKVSLGDWAIFWGNGKLLEQVSLDLNTSQYELVAGVAARVKRVVVE